MQNSEENNTTIEDVPQEQDDTSRPDLNGQCETLLRGGRKRSAASMPAVVEEFIDFYKENQRVGIHKVVQFFISSSGCAGTFTVTMLETMSPEDILNEMTFKFTTEYYPIALQGSTWKTYRIKLDEFLRVLVRVCQNSIIYDQCLMNAIIKFLIPMGNSFTRAFRHTATFIAMKLMTALAVVIRNLLDTLDTTMRQYQAERKKKLSSRSSERLELLEHKCKELGENANQLNGMLDSIFNSIFVDRTRDTLPDIRSICVSEIGVWMLKLPERFLNMAHLEPYVNLSLYDKNRDVCLKTLETLKPLYEDEICFHVIKPFVARYKDRIVRAMTWDSDFVVALEAVKLAIIILTHHREFLTDSDLQRVFYVVFSINRALGQEAGKFAQMVISQDNNDHQDEETAFIRNLVDFFLESGLLTHAAFLVDSMIDSTPIMKNWKCMSSLLLDEPITDDEIPLNNGQEASLIEIMMHCVKQAATGESPRNCQLKRTKLSGLELGQVNTDRAELTEHFIGSLPRLLTKYMTDAEKVANLMIIPQYFDLFIYVTNRQEHNLGLLLKLINEVVTKYTDTDVLKACSKTYLVLCDEKFTLHSRCTLSRNTLIDNLVDQYQSVWTRIKETLESDIEEHDEDTFFELLSSLTRISVFFQDHDLSLWDLWTSLEECTTKYHMLPVEVAQRAISSCYRSIMCDFSKLDKSDPNPEEVERLHTRIDHIVNTCITILKYNHDDLHEQAYTCLCEVLLDFCKRSLGDNMLMQTLVVRTNESHMDVTTDFVLSRVFIEIDENGNEDTRFKEIQKRRKFLNTYLLLICYEVFRIPTVQHIYQHYVKFHQDYGDIMLDMWKRFRVNNLILCAKTMVSSLTNLFNELRGEDSDAINRDSDDFSAIKVLAKRFSTMFFKEQNKNRLAVAALHQEGCLFSLYTWLQPPNDQAEPHSLPNRGDIAFFEIVKEFSNLLNKRDKKDVLVYLNKLVEPFKDKIQGDDWEPFVSYRESLSS